MITWLYRWRNLHKLDELERKLDTYRKANQQLEDRFREYESYKLKYELAKLYIDDDPALEELFSLAQQRDRLHVMNQLQMGAARAQCDAARPIGSVVPWIG